MRPSTSDLVPNGTWDCHFHILDPAKFPYKATRTYTPGEATLGQLMSSTYADNFLIVQGSVEDGLTGIITHLQRGLKEYPGKTFRAEINLDEDLSDEELQQLHELGVRCVRLHGEIGIPLENREAIIKQEFERLAKVAQKTGWYIAAMCSLQTWLDLGPWLTSSPSMKNVKVIIEHSGRPDPTKDVEDYPEFDQLVQFLKANQNQFSVKLCGINRLESESDPPGKMKAVPGAVLKLAREIPDSVIWGTDWPHVKYKGEDRLKSVPGKEVDVQNELVLLRNALPESTWMKLMVHNPTKLFN